MSDTDTAIVPVGETGLAEPKRSWWQRKPKPMPTKQRHFVAITPPSETYRESDAPIVEYRVENSADTDRWRIGLEVVSPSRDLFVAFGSAVVQTLGLGALGFALFGPSGVVLGVAGLISGLVSGAAAAGALARRKREALMAGRPYEDEELAAAVDRLAAFAGGDVMPSAEPLHLPVESLFRALGHDDPAVQLCAANLIAQLPQEVRADGIAAFSKYLTLEQLALLPGMEAMTPEMAAANGIGRSSWPKMMFAIPVGKK